MSIAISHETESQSRILSIKFPQKQLLTPTYFPAISSIETKHDINDLVTLINESAYPQMLISAYDYHYRLSKNKKIKNIINNYSKNGNLLFVDSGGYERFWEKNKIWNFNMYKKTISKINSNFYTSLDVVDSSSIKKSNYEKFFKKIIDAGIILESSQYVSIFHADTNVKLVKIIEEFLKVFPYALNYFAVRERELGLTIKERAKTIFKIRSLLNKNGGKQILHVLGAGHPTSIALYAYCGADSFDSTDWSRFTIDIESLGLRDFSHLELLDCPCKSCTKVSNPIIKTLLHNLDMYHAYMEKIRRHIQKNSLKELLFQNKIDESFIKSITTNN